MVCICTPLGLHPPYFFPQKAGKDYELTPYLEVLKDFRDDFTVISGLSHPDVGSSHDSIYSFLTAAPHPGAAGRLPQHASRWTSSRPSTSAAETRFPSLALSCEGFGLSWTRSGAHRAVGFLAVQRVRPAVPRGPARRGRRPRPAACATAGASSTRSATRPRSCSRRSAPATATSSTSTSPASASWSSAWPQAEEWSKKPKPKVDAKPPQNITNPADLVGRTRLLFDLIHLALQTDSTRLDHAAAARAPACVPPIPGVTLGHHDLSHHGQDPSKIAQLKMVELEEMKTLRDFLAKLKETKEEGASLLDRTMVFFSSNLGNASNHSRKNLPVLLAGGGFKHGQHLAFDPKNPPPLCNLYVTMLQRLGIEADKFGSSTGTLTGLETAGSGG